MRGNGVSYVCLVQGVESIGPLYIRVVCTRDFAAVDEVLDYGAVRTVGVVSYDDAVNARCGFGVGSRGGSSPARVVGGRLGLGIEGAH